MDVKPNRFTNDLQLLEECFEDLKLGHNNQSALRQIKKVLVRLFNQDFEVIICENKTNKFFGMSVFPDEETCQKLIDSLVLDKPHMQKVLDIWAENKNWMIEIDSLLLKDKNLNANPAEIVSVMLHEIGHTVYANSIPSRLFKVIKFEMTNVRLMTRNLFKHKKFRTLFFPAIVSSCGYKMFKYLGDHEEVEADNFVVKMGYGEHLNNFLNKLIASQGNEFMQRDEQDAEQEIKIMTLWSIENINELRSRKSKLKQQLNAQILKSPSQYVKNMLFTINKIFFKSDVESRNKIDSVLLESCLIREINYTHKKAEEEVVQEFTIIPTGKVKKIDLSEIDYISVQIEKMDNYDDKVYLLDLIHYHLEWINMGLEYIENGKANKVYNTKVELLQYKKQLENMRQLIMKTRIPEKQYGLFVKYPKGYEG